MLYAPQVGTEKYRPGRKKHIALKKKKKKKKKKKLKKKKKKKKKKKNLENAC